MMPNLFDPRRCYTNETLNGYVMFSALNEEKHGYLKLARLWDRERKGRHWHIVRLWQLPDYPEDTELSYILIN